MQGKIRHLIFRGGNHYWQPSKTVLALGLQGEALGPDKKTAIARAVELNAMADAMRAESKQGSNSAKPGTVSRLFAAYRNSEEFGELKPRTQSDYNYEMDWIEETLGTAMVRAFTAKSLKTYYRKLKADKGICVSYHRFSVFRTVLTWAVSEDWISDNPAKKVKVKIPRKRAVIWTLQQMEIYRRKASELGWHSIVAMIHVFYSMTR